MKFKLGFILAGLYLLVCAYFIATQGLFGESFIGLIVGLPWSLIPAYFEFGNVEGTTLYVLILLPLALNALLLYCIGACLDKRIGRPHAESM